MGSRGDFFGQRGIIARLGFVSVDNGGRALRKHGLRLPDLLAVGVFFIANRRQFIPIQQHIEISLRHIQAHIICMIFQADIRHLRRQPALPVLGEAAFIIKNLACLHIPAVALGIGGERIRLLLVNRIGADLRQQRRARLIFLFCLGIAAVFGSGMVG